MVCYFPKNWSPMRQNQFERLLWKPVYVDKIIRTFAHSPDVNWVCYVLAQRKPSRTKEPRGWFFEVILTRPWAVDIPIDLLPVHCRVKLFQDGYEAIDEDCTGIWYTCEEIGDPSSMRYGAKMFPKSDEWIYGECTTVVDNAEATFRLSNRDLLLARPETYFPDWFGAAFEQARGAQTEEIQRAGGKATGTLATVSFVTQLNTSAPACPAGYMPMELYKRHVQSPAHQSMAMSTGCYHPPPVMFAEAD